MIRNTIRALTDMGFGSIAAWRVLNMGISFALYLIATREIVIRFGVSSFADYAILISLLASLPFADLGLGAAVVNVTIDYRAGRVGRLSYVTALKYTILLLMGVAATLAIFGVFITLSDWWPILLGDAASEPASGEWALAVVMGVALALPLGVGTRILEGAADSLLVTKLLFVGTAVQALALLAFVATGADAHMYVLGPIAGMVFTNAACLVAGLRSVSIRPRELIGARARPGLAMGYKPIRTALPYLIVTIGITLTLQFQRVLLSHVSSAAEVASYSFVAQFTVATNSVLTLGSMNLWAAYRDITGSDGAVLRFKRDVGAFAIAGVLFAAVACCMVSLVVPWAGGGSLRVSPGTYVAAGAAIVVWALARPGIMCLNFSRGFVFQAAWAAPCAVVSVGLTLILGSSMGAAGAFAASAVSVLLFTVLPNSLFSAHHLNSQMEGW